MSASKVSGFVSAASADEQTITAMVERTNSRTAGRMGMEFQSKVLSSSAVSDRDTGNPF
jgi:hypothetical protein